MYIKFVNCHSQQNDCSLRGKLWFLAVSSVMGEFLGRSSINIWGMNEWHGKGKYGETDMEKWMGMGGKSMKCSQWHLWHTCLPLAMVKSHPPWQVQLCICKQNLRRGKEDYQAVLPVLTLLSESLILNSSSTTFLWDFSQVSQPLQTLIYLPKKWTKRVCLEED